MSEEAHSLVEDALPPLDEIEPQEVFLDAVEPQDVSAEEELELQSAVDVPESTVFSLNYRTAKNNSKRACPEVFRA